MLGMGLNSGPSLSHSPVLKQQADKKEEGEGKEAILEGELLELDLSNLLFFPSSPATSIACSLTAVALEKEMSCC